MSSGFLPPSLTSMFERNQEATCYVGNLDLRVNEDVLWELFLQCGPVVNVHVPRDKITGEHQGFGFVEFRSEEDSDYSIKIMHMIKLYGKPIKVNKASQDKITQEVEANIFIGNLHDDVDEKMLKDVFSAFGVVLSTKIMRDPDSGSSKRYGFVSFDNFDSSDASINTMNGQFLRGRVVDVSYAYKKDTKGERHGSVAERILAANRPNSIYTPMFPIYGGSDTSMKGANNHQNMNNMKSNGNAQSNNMNNMIKPPDNHLIMRNSIKPPIMPPNVNINEIKTTFPIIKPTKMAPPNNIPGFMNHE